MFIDFQNNETTRIVKHFLIPIIIITVTKCDYIFAASSKSKPSRLIQILLHHLRYLFESCKSILNINFYANSTPSYKARNTDMLMISVNTIITLLNIDCN